jgi:ribosome biogenesis GTPase A
VGKSTLINALRFCGVGKGTNYKSFLSTYIVYIRLNNFVAKVATVAPYAGVTRAIQTRVKIHADPDIYLVDTPGVW